MVDIIAKVLGIVLTITQIIATLTEHRPNRKPKGKSKRREK